MQTSPDREYQSFFELNLDNRITPEAKGRDPIGGSSATICQEVRERARDLRTGAGYTKLKLKTR